MALKHKDNIVINIFYSDGDIIEDDFYLCFCF